MMQAAANQALNETNGNRYNFGSTVIPSGTVTCFGSAGFRLAERSGATTRLRAGDVRAGQHLGSGAAAVLELPAGRRIAHDDRGVVGRCRGQRAVVHGLRDRAGRRAGAGLRRSRSIGASSREALYTFYYSCTGTTPGPIAGTPTPYVILNRVDPDLDESNQMFRQGAQGLTGSTIATPNACTISSPTAPASCVNIGDIESIPASGNATPGQCAAGAPQVGCDEPVVRAADTLEHRGAPALPDERDGFRHALHAITSPTPSPITSTIRRHMPGTAGGF